MRLFTLCLCILFLDDLVYADGGVEKECSIESIADQCNDENWQCVQKNGSSLGGICECTRGTELINGNCVKRPPTTTLSPTDAPKIEPEPKRDSGGGSTAAGLLVPTFLILLGAAGYYGARRYKWLQRLRLYRQNRYGNMLVTRDDTDDDDPPIA